MLSEIEFLLVGSKSTLMPLIKELLIIMEFEAYKNFNKMNRRSKSQRQNIQLKKSRLVDCTSSLPTQQVGVLTLFYAHIYFTSVPVPVTCMVVGSKSEM